MRDYPASVIGIRHDGRLPYITSRVRPGDDLDLEAEPENPYDPRAVAVYHHGTKIGYVPADRKWVWNSIAEGDTIGGLAGELVLNADGDPVALSMTITIYRDGPGVSDLRIASAAAPAAPAAPFKNVRLPRQRSSKSKGTSYLISTLFLFMGLAVLVARSKEPVPPAATVKEADALPRTASSVSPSRTPPPFGNWAENRSSSKLSNRESVFYSLDASGRVPDSIGIPHYPAMRVMCLENETRVLFDFNHYHGADPVPVKWKTDGGKLRSQTMSVSERGNVFGFWNGQGIPMLKDLMGKKELVIAAAPWGGSPIEVTFDLDGIDAVVAAVRANCSW